MNPRFLTDADQPGVERLSISAIRRDFGLQPTHLFSASDIAAENAALLGPQALFCVKGYTRSLAAFVVMVSCREVPSILEARRLAT